MKKKQRKHLSVRETPAFKELLKDLKNQVPDEQKKLREMLDEVINEDTATPDNK